MNRDERYTIIEVLCHQALADHLGDVRNAEVQLWELLGVRSADIVGDYNSAWRNTRATLIRAGFELPTYLTADDDLEDEE